MEGASQWPRNRQEKEELVGGDVNGMREVVSRREVVSTYSCTAWECELGKVVSRFYVPNFHTVSI